jgi:putative transposase
MARRRKLSPERKEFIDNLLQHYDPQNVNDVQEMLKDLLGDTLQGMLEAEMDDHLGYSKYDYQNKETDDSRNGYSPKTVTSSVGKIDLDIPRVRKGNFEPQIVKKHQTDISSIEDQVLSMYAKGMTTRDISDHLRSVYGVDVSAEMISHMTDRILPMAKEWQNRPLERKYAIVFMDAVHFHVRQEGHVIKKAVYIAIGIKLNGTKEVLGMWIGGNESAKYWLGVLNEIKNRGVEDIMVISVDGLTGFVDAIGSVFPQAEIQRCIVHQIRYTTKFVSYKDIRKFMADLKLVYQAATEEAALEALDGLEENWGKKYPSSVSSWRNNWPQLCTYFKYPPEIRQIIYTTNSIENFNRQLRKVTKTRSVFPTDDALFKLLYLAMMDITTKWKGKPNRWNWGQILNQLMIYFEGRIEPEDIE